MFQIFDPAEKTFFTQGFSSNTIRTKTTSAQNVVNPIFILNGIINIEEVDVYETQVLNFVDVFGLVGGLFELLIVTSGIFVEFLSNFWFKKEIEYKNTSKTESLFTHPPYSDKSANEFKHSNANNNPKAAINSMIQNSIRNR